MKSRHAAALVLVGWYLLIPPVITTGAAKSPRQFVWGDAPLNLWHRVSGFDDASDCQNYLFDMKRAYEDPVFRAEIDQRDENVAREYGTQADPVTGQDRLRRWSFGQCVASDDPRLKASATR